MVVSNGDIRQEMELMFGPNIIANLDKVDLSYDEAAKMVSSDIVLRRMMYYRVNAKALKKVTPITIRQAYDEFAKTNIRNDKWDYQVISVRSEDATQGAHIAHLASVELTENGVSADQLVDLLKEKGILTTGVNINVSELYSHDAKEISANYKEILDSMESGTYSQPLAQRSRANSGSLFRIFYLKSKIPGGVIPFAEIENRIKESLLDAAITEETRAYLVRLRQHFDVQDSQLKEMIADNFQPFVMR